MRNNQRLIDIRKLPCVKCGYPAPSQAAHSNFAEHGKGRGIKADDNFTIPLCHICHRWFDTYESMNRQKSKDWFMQMLDKTNRMLNIGDEVF